MADSEPALTTPVVESDAPSDTSRPANPEDREKHRKALAGLAAVAGIAIAGVALGTLVILWAGRLRRINREPLPAARLQNELWFLRPPKPPVSETPPEMPAEDIPN